MYVGLSCLSYLCGVPCMRFVAKRIVISNQHYHQHHHHYYCYVDVVCCLGLQFFTPRLTKKLMLILNRLVQLYNSNTQMKIYVCYLNCENMGVGKITAVFFIHVHCCLQYLHWMQWFWTHTISMVFCPEFPPIEPCS